MKNRIVSAAMKMKDGEVVMGVRHFSLDMRHTLRKLYGDCYHKLVEEQGFIDAQGEFLSREAAYEAAKVNDQIIRQVGGDKKRLFSENLY